MDKSLQELNEDHAQPKEEMIENLNKNIKETEVQ